MVRYKSAFLDACRFARGFSLFEMALLLGILGVLVVPIMQGFQIARKSQETRDLQTAMTKINNALGEYFILKGEYPCPADPTLERSDVNYAVADCDADWTGGNVTAVGYDGINNIDGTGGADRVLIGALPVNTLIGLDPADDTLGNIKLQVRDMIDPYNSKLTYAVSQSMTPDSPNGPGTASPRFGIIQVNILDVDSDGNIIREPQVVLLPDNNGNGDPDNDENPTDGFPDNGLLHAVVLSHGADRKGAYHANGGTKNPCSFADGEDAENCDNDSVFAMAVPLEVPGASYFDDYLISKIWSFNSLWELTTADNISNTNSGNVGVNTTTPQERLQIAADLKANQIKADFVCAEIAGSTQCFDPLLLAGDDPDAGEGMRCPANQVMRGISNGAPDCVDVELDVSDLAGKTCPPGEFVLRIKFNGDLACAPRN